MGCPDALATRGRRRADRSIPMTSVTSADRKVTTRMTATATAGAATGAGPDLGPDPDPVGGVTPAAGVAAVAEGGDPGPLLVGPGPAHPEDPGPVHPEDPGPAHPEGSSPVLLGGPGPGPYRSIAAGLDRWAVLVPDLGPEGETIGPVLSMR